MRPSVRVAAIAAAICLGAAASRLASAQNNTDTAVLADIEQGHLKAFLMGDSKTYGAMLAADWSTIDATGRMLTREQLLLQMFGNRDLKIQSAVIDGMNVRTYGDTAIVTGRVMATSTYQGKRYDTVLRFTDVFVRREGHWLAVASQQTAIAP
jgi:ketosteroid isomerase-like protein